MADKTQPTIEDLKAPLLAAVGAADLALATVNEIVATLRERAGEARSDAEARVEESRARLARLQEELPGQFGELREKLTSEELRKKLTSEELRKAAESYADQATATYNKLVERGEAALERLRNQPALEEAANRVEGYTDQAVELTQEALGTVASQTRAVGERAAKLVGVELPKRTEAAAESASEAAAEAAEPVKKAAAPAAKKAAPAKKSAPAKKTAPAKTAAKAPAKKVTQK
ncbi:heparin-binding hemagglutinin [Mycobacterium sp. SWH-M5]|uniref:heparin-binding hemagglutinin n=1 Tax=Mycolicibacterium goodii TaxID=134601 RepID=UPI00093F8903|nr:heparin-binding hemagglutinin [Mycolicibacterium goodii]OKH67743.1 heparin-binding hemagglutinin [Mycobacterium sp. SWH-M5]PJK22923.1 heparin-binding hemagglutinin [Mycolicibacterium goodii]